MGSLENRLERLEAGRTRSEADLSKEALRRRSMERFYHASENARRERHGLEPLPDLPYTKEDRMDDEDTLENTIPAYRSEPGWQTGEAAAFLEHWERDLTEKLKRT